MKEKVKRQEFNVKLPSQGQVQQLYNLTTRIPDTDNKANFSQVFMPFNFP